MLKVGLTGGIGSGKSMVARLFRLLGIPVYFADDVAKRIMNEDSLVRASVIEHFGGESYNEKGLNREYIAGRVFSNQEELAILNAIVHPVTIADAGKWMEDQVTTYAIKEAALMFEAKANLQLDYVIGVTAPVELRLERVVARDKVSPDQVKARMEKQMDEAEKMLLCDFVIYNDEQKLLIPQVLDIHEKLINLATSQEGNHSPADK